MKTFYSTNRAGNISRSRRLMKAATLAACVLLPLGLHAQLNYLGGTAEIEFDAEPVAVYGGIPPLFVGDTYTGGNDILSSPGGGFNEINYVNAPIVNTGVIPLGAGVFASLNAGVYPSGPFGGGIIALTPTLGAFAIGEVAPGFVSAGISAQTANFTIGAGGLPGAPATIGTFLSIAGTLNPTSAIAASLVTYIQDTTTGANATLTEVLGATGIASASTQNLSGGVPGIGIGGLNALNSFMLYGPGDATYAGLAAASVPNFLNPGDNVTVTSVFTAGADPDATIDSEPLPSNLDGVTLPGDDLYGSEIPEPSTVTLFGAGALALLARFRRKA